MLEKGFYTIDKKKVLQGRLLSRTVMKGVHIRNDCDIKPGPVLGQAVSRPSMEHTIFVFIIIDQQTVWTAVRSAHYPVIL